MKPCVRCGRKETQPRRLPLSPTRTPPKPSHGFGTNFTGPGTIPSCGFAGRESRSFSPTGRRSFPMATRFPRRFWTSSRSAIRGHGHPDRTNGRGWKRSRRKAAGQPTQQCGRRCRSRSPDTPPPMSDARFRAGFSRRPMTVTSQQRRRWGGTLPNNGTVPSPSPPTFVFVTGWNEWVAQRFVVAPGQKITMGGKPVPVGGTFFVDTFSGEYNRDLEPSRTEGDTLYYQLVANVRRYKGARPVPLSGPATTIALNHEGDWANIMPEYRDPKGDTFHRDADGWGSLHYTDTTGRNDIVRAKVAYDRNNVYFWVETAAPLTPHTDPHWMSLFLDTDQNGQTGWQGYDFAVNLVPPKSGSQAVLSRYTGAWKSAGTVAYSVQGNHLSAQNPPCAAGPVHGKPTIDLRFPLGRQRRHRKRRPSSLLPARRFRPRPSLQLPLRHRPNEGRQVTAVAAR